MRRRQTQGTQVLEPITASQFDGGLNLVDSDLNINSRYAKILTNMVRTSDAGLEVRPGTRLFSTIPELSDIIALHYYSVYLIAIDRSGVIAAVDARGNYQIIWNETLANNLPGAPSGWGTTTKAQFAEFAGELIIVNGFDKPLLVTATLVTTYLADVATTSNVNVPIAEHVITASGGGYGYLVMADGSTLYISNQDTSGTWSGDVSSDGVNFNLATQIDGDATIVGLGIFRSNLVILFPDAVLIVTLGVYNTSGDHTPTFNEPIQANGTVASRSVKFLGDDLLFADNNGVASLRRAALTTQLAPDRPSVLVDPGIRAAMNRLSLTTQSRNVFAVNNAADKQYMLFIPGDTYDLNTPWEVYVFTFVPKLKISAWSKFGNWRFRCAAKSAEDRLFLAQGNMIFILGTTETGSYGTSIDPIYSDLQGYAEVFDDGTTFEDGTGLTPAADTDVGLPIPFEWVLPWSALNQLGRIKKSKYISFETSGEAQFLAEMYIDRFYYDRSFVGQAFSDETLFSDGFGWEAEPDRTPQLSMNFIGGSAGGYGAQGYGQAYGGGRLTDELRLYAWPAKFSQIRHRISGSATRPLKITAVTLLTTGPGSIRRA